MKKFFAIVTVIALAAAAFAQKAGDKVSFSSVDMAGNAVTSDIFAKNKLTMVNIWGTFCPPCIREMPDLAKLNSANKSKGVEVVGIPIDIVDESSRLAPTTHTSFRLRTCWTVFSETSRLFQRQFSSTRTEKSSDRCILEREVRKTGRR